MTLFHESEIMATNGVDERSGREIGLLVLVIVVAVVGLLVLARFRFPAADLAGVSPTPGPLERLTDRATFDDLSSAIANVSGRVAPWFVVIDALSVPEPPAKDTAATPVEAVPVLRRLLPALRVRADLVLAYLPPGLRVAAVHGSADAPTIVASDTPRGVVLVRVPAESGVPVDFAEAVPNFTGVRYVAAIEAAAGGPTARPVFVPRVDSSGDGRWQAPTLAIGAAPEPQAGAFLVTLDGRLIGLTVSYQGRMEIVPAAALDRAVAELSNAGTDGSR